MKVNKVKQAEQITVKRSEIHAAPYNPRKITPEAAKLLKDNLKRVGLLGGIVWNQRTGNLVSGHQKMAQMDAINRYDPDNPDTDYEFRVEVVDLPENEEKQQNLFMNNKNAQGVYDDDMLREMLSDSEVDYRFAGFDDFDMQLLGLDEGLEAAANYSDERWRESNITGQGFEAPEDATVNEEAAKKSQEFKNAGENTRLKRDKNFYEDSQENQLARHAEIQKIKDRISKQNDVDKDGGMLSYTIISFQSPSECESFLYQFGYPVGTKYISGQEFLQRLEFGIEEEPAE